MGTNLIQSEAIEVNGHDLLDARPSDLDGLLQAFQDSFRITEDLLQDARQKRGGLSARRSTERLKVEEERRGNEETRRLTLSFLPFLPGTSSCHQR